MILLGPSIDDGDESVGDGDDRGAFIDNDDEGLGDDDIYGVKPQMRRRKWRSCSGAAKPHVAGFWTCTQPDLSELRCRDFLVWRQRR